MNRKLNWKPDLPDYRDHVYSLQASKLPTHVDLRPFMSKVEDQGELGSCTGNAFVGAMEFLENKNAQKFTDLSRLFVYYGERQIENTIRQDAGAIIRDGVKVLSKLGVSSEKLWPYDVAKFRRKPSASAFKDALNRRVSEYLRVTSFAGVKENLADGFPVVFGFTVYSSFMSDAVARNGMMPMPQKGDTMEGGHAVLAVGYDDAKRAAIIRNSWGDAWGDKGYFYMPYDYLSNANLCDDMWTIRK